MTVFGHCFVTKTRKELEKRVLYSNPKYSVAKLNKAISQGRTIHGS